MDVPVIHYTLVIAAILRVASGMIYVTLGRRLARRQVSPETRLASRAFSGFWLLLGVSSLVGAIPTLLAALSITSFPLMVINTVVQIVVISVAVGGLVYYFLALLTDHRWTLHISVVYAVCLTLYLFYVIAANDPIGVEVRRWNVSLRYGTPIDHGTTLWRMLLVLIGPPMLGSLAYMLLIFRVKARSQRFRIGMVSSAIFFWFLSSFVATSMGWNRLDWWQFTSRFIGVWASILVFLAFFPPAQWERRFGIRRVEEDVRA